MESGNTPPLILNFVQGDSGQFHAPAVLPPGERSTSRDLRDFKFRGKSFWAFSRGSVGEQAGGQGDFKRGVVQKREHTRRKLETSASVRPLL